MATSTNRSDLARRLGTVAWLLPATVAAILLLPAPWVAGLLVLAFLRTTWELSSLPRVRPWRTGLLGAAVLVGALLAWSLRSESLDIRLFLGAAASLWILALIAVLRYPFALPRWALVLAAFAVNVPPALGLGWMVIECEEGARHLLAFLAIVAAADSGAYFAGRRFGKHKLAPRVSGAKTWEGLVGGLVAAIGMSALAMLLLSSAGLWLVPVAAATAAASVLGDLTASVFKRDAGWSDYPVLLPGHGGLLDRLDGWTCAGPLYAWGVIQLGA